MFSVKDMHRTLGRKSGGLVYFGGPVISNVKVYAVFWGDTVNAETQQKIGPFFANMLDSTYMDWLSEYDTNIQAVDGRQGTGQHIGRGSFAGSVTLHPANAASALTDTMIQQELDAQIAAGALPPSDENTLYMVYFPKGVSISDGSDRSCSTFCAYHEAFKSATRRGLQRRRLGLRRSDGLVLARVPGSRHRSVPHARQLSRVPAGLERHQRRGSGRPVHAGQFHGHGPRHAEHRAVGVG